MLILTRRVGETLMIGDSVTVTVLGVKGNQVRVGITHAILSGNAPEILANAELDELVVTDTIRLSDTVTLRPFTDEDAPGYAGWRDGVPGWAVALYMIGSTNAIGDDGDRWLDEIAAGGSPGSGGDPEEQPGDWVYPRR